MNGASARISGQREHNGEIVATAEWAAIITPAETVQIRAKLAEPERRTNKAARRYLLGGLLVEHIAWQAIFFINVIYSLLAGPKAPDNPWGAGATTLEWTLSSPPPYHQFETLPRIH